MIHVNNGDLEHEWITDEEFENRFPEVAEGLKGIDEAEGQKLYQFRKKKGIVLRDMAELMDVGVAFLSRIERGLEDITPEVRNKYLYALHKSDKETNEV